MCTVIIHSSLIHDYASSSFASSFLFVLLFRLLVLFTIIHLCCCSDILKTFFKLIGILYSSDVLFDISIFLWSPALLPVANAW